MTVKIGNFPFTPQRVTIVVEGAIRGKAAS
jgi:hypothetical protein